MASASMATDKADEGLEAVLANYLRAAEEGRAPDRMELLARHPDLAPDLAEFFAGQEQFTRLAAPLRDAVSAAQESTIEDKLAEGGRLGDFRLLHEVGRGGMGIVYEAEQISLGRRVALKVLPFAGALDAKQLQRFKNEAHAAAHLQHQNIVPVHFVGCERGVHFYAMQFVEGQTLAALIQELRQSLSGGRQPSEGSQERPASRVALALGAKTEDRGSQKLPGQSDPLLTDSYSPELAAPERDAQCLPADEKAPPTVEDRGALIETVSAPPRSSILDSGSSFFRTVANLGIQAAEALEHAHQMGVIHRDIKPANLIIEPLAPTGERGRGEGAVATGVRLWITDFGLAHCQGGCDLTMSGDLLGTLRYISPEQALAKRVIVDERTDIYSLGVTLYELLTLEAAFPGTDRQEVLRQIAFEDPKPPRRFNKAIPIELETIVLKAMEKNPADRYATAKELAEDLQHFLDDKPIRAKRPTQVQRFRKWTRRHPGVARTAIGALLSAVLILAIGTVWIAKAERNERAERKHAEEAEGKAKENLRMAQEAERQKTEKLWHEKLARAQALRRSGSAGRRIESLKALAEAAQIARTLNVLEEDILKLRNEAIACMALADMKLEPEYDTFMNVPAPGNKGPPSSRTNWPDAQLERYANTDERGTITIRRIPGDEEILRLKGPGIPASLLYFSPDGRYLAGNYLRPSVSNPGQVIIWNLARAEVALELPSEFADTQTFGTPTGQLRWSPDSRCLAAHGPSDIVAIFDVASRKEIQRFTAKVSRNQMAFHPNGKQLAVLGPPIPDAGNLQDRFAEGRGSRLGASVQIRDVEKGTLVDQFALPTPSLHFGWGSDGRFMATACVFFPIEGADNDGFYVWDVPARRLHKIPQGPGANNVAFNHAGDLLASDGGDGTIRLWNPWTGKELLRVDGGEGNLEFTTDDRFLLVVDSWGGPRRCWRVTNGYECRHLYSPTENTKSIGNVAFSPDGRWLAASGNDGIRLWDVATGKHIAWVSPGSSDSFGFDADGKGIVTRGPSGQFRWPLLFEQDQTSRRLRIGPPGNPAMANQPGASDDGAVRGRLAKLRVFLHPWRETKLLDRATGQQMASLTSPEPHSFQTFAFNPEGTQLALAGQTNMIELWDLRSVREQLAEMGLDWHLPAYPQTTNSEASKPLQVQMQPGHMIDREKQSLVIGLFPYHAEAYYQRGLASIKFGQLAQASADFTMTVALKPDYAEAYYQRGAIHFGGDRRREAEADFTRAIGLRPDYAEAYAARAKANIMLGQYPSAVTDFSKMIKFSGWQPTLNVYFRHALARLGAGDHAGYRRVCAAMFECFGGSPDLWTSRVVVSTCVLGPNALIDPSLVVRLAEKPFARVAKDSDSPFLASSLSTEFWKSLGNVNEQFDSLLYLGAAHYRAGNLSEALQRLCEAQATDGGGGPDGHRCLSSLFLAMVHARLGNQQKARELLDQVLPMEEVVRVDHSWHLHLTFVLLRDEAEGLVLGPEAVAEDRGRFAADDPRLAYTLARFGHTLLRTHQPLEAEKVLRECLTIGEKKEPDAWTTFNARSLLGQALLGQKKYADAELLLVQGFEGLSQRETNIAAHMRQVRLTDALDRLVHLYDAWEKPEQAGKWRKNLETHKLKIGPELPPYQKDKKHSSQKTQ